ncbi:Hypothetical protein I5071_19020 [Sandaracinus amylolyticus]|nr:Hypothetical protein I5071_19020 [Sandaracinus amylolyticus]
MQVDGNATAGARQSPGRLNRGAHHHGRPSKSNRALVVLIDSGALVKEHPCPPPM